MNSTSVRYKNLLMKHPRQSSAYRAVSNRTRPNNSLRRRSRTHGSVQICRETPRQIASDQEPKDFMDKIHKTSVKETLRFISAYASGFFAMY